MELKDVQFERLGDAAKLYPDSTLIIRKQFFDGVVDKLQSTIQRRTEMFIQEREWRIGTGNELHKEYHNSFELREEIRKQKYRRCLAMVMLCDIEEFNAEDCHCERRVDWAIKWLKKWTELAEQYKQPLEFIEKDLTA